MRKRVLQQQTNALVAWRWSLSNLLLCLYGCTQRSQAQSTTETSTTNTTTTTTTTTLDFVFKVGVGVTITDDTAGGAPFLGPPSPTSVINALHLWVKTVNTNNFETADGRRIHIKLYIEDDKGTEVGARNAYSLLRGFVHAFLGPSLESRAAAVLKQLALHQSNVPILYWASHAQDYFLTPLNDRGPNSALEERAKLGLSRSTMNYGGERDIGTDPDGDIWPVYEEYGRPHVFDINVPLSERMNYAMYQALVSFEEAVERNRSIMFLHDLRYTTLASRMVYQAINMGVRNTSAEPTSASTVASIIPMSSTTSTSSASTVASTTTSTSTSSTSTSSTVASTTTSTSSTTETTSSFTTSSTTETSTSFATSSTTETSDGRQAATDDTWAYTSATMQSCSVDALAPCMRAARRASPDIIVLLFDFSDTVTLLLALGTFNIRCRAIITLPYGRRLLDYVEATKVAGVLEPMVWAPPIECYRPSLVFSSFAEFNRTYQEDYFNISEEYAWAPYSDEFIERNFAHVPPLAAIQVAAAGEILVNALMQTDSRDLLLSNPTFEHKTALVKQIGQEDGIDTILGNVRFNNETGKRLNTGLSYNATLARQWHVLQKSPDVSLPYRYVAAEQWIINSASALMPFQDLLELRGGIDAAGEWLANISAADMNGLLSATNASEMSECPLEDSPYVSRPMRLSLRVSGEIWTKVYPCESGCEWKGIGCFGCKKGMHRASADRFCYICPVGTYSDEEGMAFCKECPEGSFCDEPGISEPPMPKVGWWRSDFPPVVVQEADEATSPYSVCRFDTMQSVFQFLECPNELCQGPNGCSGENLGYLCGQCPIGYSYYWLYPGMRRCWSCSGIWPSISFFVVFAGFLLTLLVFEVLARRTTDARTSGAWAIIRAMYHNAHLMIASAEATGQDSLEELANLMQYFDHTYRPLDLIPWDCFLEYPPEGNEEAMADYRMSILKLRLRISEFMTGMGLVLIFCGSLTLTFGRVMTTKTETPRQREERLFKAHKDKLERERLKKEREEQEAAEARAEEEEERREKEAKRARGEEDSSDSDEDPKVKAKRRKQKKEAKAKAKAKAAARAAARAEAARLEAEKARALQEVGKRASGGRLAEVDSEDENEHPGGEIEPQSPTRMTSPRMWGGSSSKKSPSPAGAAEPEKDEKDLSAEQGRQQYNLVRGPGAHFARTSFLRDLQRSWYTVMRLSIIWLILTYAPTIRQLLRIAACVTMEDKVKDARPRLRDDYGIFCDTDAYKSIQAEVTTALYFFASMPVAFVAIQLIRQHHKVDDLEGRLVWSILTDGVKTEYWWWEAVTMVRTLSFVIISNTFRNVDLCSWVLIFNAGFFMVLTEYFEPYTNQDRWVLCRLDRYGMMAVWLMLLGAQVCNGFGGILTEAGIDTESQTTYRYLVTITIIVYQFGLIFYGILTLVFKMIVQDLDIYSKAAGFYLDPFSNRFLKFMRVIWGLNDMRVRMENNKVILDIGQLTSDENEMLNECYQDFVAESIFQYGTLRPVVMQRAIDQVFLKAIASRKARIRAWYTTYGMKAIKLFKIPSLISCCTVSMAAPDIVEEEPDTGGVTVEELQYAFMDTVADFKMNLQPPLYSVEAIDDNEKGEAEKVEFDEKANLESFAKDAVDLGRIEVLGSGRAFPLAAICERHSHDFLWMGVAEPKSFTWCCMESRAKRCAGKMIEDQPLKHMTNKFKCTVCGYEVCDKCFQAMSRCGQTTVRVTIQRLYWTKRSMAVANHKPYIAMDIPGREGSMVRTLAALNAERPVWRHTEEAMPHYTTGDPLRFSVRDSYFDRDGELGSGMLTYNTFSLRDYEGIIHVKDRDGEIVCYVEVHTLETKVSHKAEKHVYPSKVPHYLKGHTSNGRQHDFEARLLEQIKHVEGAVKELEMENVKKDYEQVTEINNLEEKIDDWFEGDEVSCQGRDCTVVWDGRPNQATAMVQYPNGEKRMVSTKLIEIKQELLTT